MSLSDVAGAGSQVFGARFNILNVLPGTLLVAFIVVLARSGAYTGGEVDLERVMPDEWLAGGTIVFLVAMVLVGILLRPFQVALVQVLEGYWGGSGTVLSELHVRRRRTAEIEVDLNPSAGSGLELGGAAARSRAVARTGRRTSRAQRRLLRYPIDESHVMPTLLGNILRRVETQAGERYGLDTIATYPRLYPLLSDRLEKEMSQNLDQLDAAAALCVTFLLATGAGTPLLVRLDWWSCVPLVTLLLAVLAYRGALSAAAEQGDLVATCFDLHRFDLLAAMHLPLPERTSDEYRLNRRLSRALISPERFHLSFGERPYQHPGSADPVELRGVLDVRYEQRPQDP